MKKAISTNGAPAAIGYSQAIDCGEFCIHQWPARSGPRHR